MSNALPSVAVLVAAYDAEPFVGQAVRSALAQDYPADRLHVVVVDDGSADATAAVVAGIADDHPGRVTLVRQENRGSVAAVNRAAAERVAVEADLLAILDADDAWPAGKLVAQASVFAERPEVGLVYTDMRVIDADGAVLQESWLSDARPPTGHGLSTFLRENLVTGSSIVVRGTLRNVLFPIPDEMAWADWWLAARAAQFSEIAYLPIPRTLYRFHATNMSLGAEGPAKLRELRKGLALQRWFLRRVRAEEMTVRELEQCWDAFARLASEALEVAGTPFVALVDVTEDDARAAQDLAADAQAQFVGATSSSPPMPSASRDESTAHMPVQSSLDTRDLHISLATAVRAAAADPFSGAARGVLSAVRAALPDGIGPYPLRGARPLVACLDADDVVRDPDVLGACAAALADLDDVTIAVDASTFDAEEAAARISALAEELGLADDPRLDLALVTGPLDELGAARLLYGLTVRLCTRRHDDDTPWFTPADVAGARALLLSRRAASSS
ncbi:glycosyltransferase [Baekduia sp.]|jgi:glycosyltransferase involved in cell wall biosynthesis|uniref:glycosyltransferase n=1 Tax=Baekduia sp. TaxID=2600305 RepID=UPI002E02F65C|nr:glycosyltransferase [Baekduia sp.]